MTDARILRIIFSNAKKYIKKIHNYCTWPQVNIHHVCPEARVIICCENLLWRERKEIRKRFMFKIEKKNMKHLMQLNILENTPRPAVVGALAFCVGITPRRMCFGWIRSFLKKRYLYGLYPLSCLCVNR